MRSDYKQPGSPDVLPPADAIVVGGAELQYHQQVGSWDLRHISFGTIDGRNRAWPARLQHSRFSTTAQAAYPTFGRSVKELREAGVKILLGSEGYEPHVPHQGSKYLHAVPVARCLDSGGDQSRVVSRSEGLIQVRVVDWNHEICQGDSFVAFVK